MKAELIKEAFKLNFDISRLRRKFFDSSYEMSRSEFVLLDYVVELEEKDEKQTISEVATELNISNAAVSRTIKHLLAKGWLFRETLEEDRRNGIIKISDDGRKIYEATNAQFNKRIEAGFKNVREEQLEQFITISRELIEGLGKSSES